MRRVDLLRGDRPWRVTLRTDPTPLRRRERAALVALGVVVPLVALHPAAWRIWAVAALLVAWGWWRTRGPELWLVGGGRPPMSSTEWREWVAHAELSAQEHEHDRKQNEAKQARSRRR